MGSDMIIAAQQGGSGAFNLLLLLAVPLVFYFLLIRPQSKRRKEQMQMQSNLVPGARIMTTSGMYANVVSVDDDGLVLEIAPGVEARFVKAAVMQVVDGEKAADEVDLTDDEDDEDLTEDEAPAKADLTKSDAKADAKAEKVEKADDDEESAGATAVGKGSKKSSD
ncbi:preprotein translocase subunit YajC [Actinomadura sp. 21ATH]|uniref:preprotein translocase subunit YajC n=1 Tax=Actinomadura sp. 21ATH TaxID=1735444 RepID=UPI0035C0CC83